MYYVLYSKTNATTSIWSQNIYKSVCYSLKIEHIPISYLVCNQ